MEIYTWKTKRATKKSSAVLCDHILGSDGNGDIVNQTWKINVHPGTFAMKERKYKCKLYMFI